ncbi:MAG TPA: ABC transporter ATP-binding protein [Candidatus Sulfomarinibacteraceae bacterium]|nr:ABC transporter ATP-binding protein [Candidatus Sulfomarinibacteraceae bacterium]
MNEPIILVNELTKRFGNLTAVDHVSFDVEAGEAVALWGANGAGKTTALRCLLHLMPFSGQVKVGGIDVQQQGKAARRLMGFVPQELSFHDDLTVAETLIFYARLKKVPADFNFTPLLERLELLPHVQKPVRDLSGGLKQRLALALALLADPPILVLDEPTSNLDIRARENFLHFLDELRKDGKTLVFSSHRLEEVKALADRVLLLEAGKLVLAAPPAELEKQLGRTTTLRLALPAQTVERAREALSAQGMLVSPNGNGRTLRVRVQPADKADVLRILYDAGVDVDDFTIE